MYKQLYKEIIDTAKNEIRTKNSEIYYESHHIVPEFLFKIRTFFHVVPWETLN